MGGIKCVTPADMVHADAPVPRTGSSNAEAVGSHGLTEVKIYHQPMTPGYSLLKAENIRTLSLESDSVGTSRRLDALWMSGTWLQILPRPGWSGYMSKMHSSNTEYSTSAVLPLPFVNMDPSNLSTIYTCLQYVAEQRSKCGQSRITVTFDQPLYAKAREMVLAAGPHSPLSGVVIRLGRFHLLLSFMGSIGVIMAGSGLEDMYMLRTVSFT